MKVLQDLSCPFCPGIVETRTQRLWDCLQSSTVWGFVNKVLEETLAYLQYPSVRRQMTLHKTKRMYDGEKVAAQLNTLCKNLPYPVAENSAMGSKAPRIEKDTEPCTKTEIPNLT